MVKLAVISSNHKLISLNFMNIKICAATLIRMAYMCIKWEIIKVPTFLNSSRRSPSQVQLLNISLISSSKLILETKFTYVMYEWWKVVKRKPFPWSERNISSSLKNYTRRWTCLTSDPRYFSISTTASL